MELNQALEQLSALQKKMYAFNTASSALFLDGATVAPRDTAEGRGVALGILAGESHKLFSAPEVGELLSFLAEHKEDLTVFQNRQVEELRSLERHLLPEDIDYMNIHGLRIEARQKLNQIRPLNLGQASRISGVSPADIAALMVFLSK